jgi:hypothetical protein
MAAWLLLVAGCLWVPSGELDVRWAELIDADGDGYDDQAYGGDDCDDGDPAVFPGAVEGLGDETDGDCDGEVDGSPWTAVDLRGSVGFQGPRLDLVHDGVLLAWQAERLEGGTALHDGFGVVRLSADDPTGSELAAWVEGGAADQGISGPFDMEAAGGNTILGLSTLADGERAITVHGLPDDLSSHHSISTEPLDEEALLMLQVGIATSDATILVGCGQDGAGIHGVALRADDLVEGEAELFMDQPLTGDGHDQGVCEVDPLYMYAYANNHPHGVEGRVYTFDLDAGTLTHDHSEMGMFAWVDREIVEHYDFTLELLLDKMTDSVLVMTIASIADRYFKETWTRLPTISVDGDIAPSVSGEAYACVVDQGGEVTLYWADLFEQGAGAPIETYTPEQYELGDLYECAVVVTPQDLLVLAVRGDEGIWINRFVRGAAGG